MRNVPSLDKSIINELQKSKNLLAFSAGSDSSALFFILLTYKIPFDIAIVDHGTRDQIENELAYAQTLSQQYNKKLYIKHVSFQSKSNFEKNARKVRYDFFNSLVNEFHYTHLLTAHHLFDQLEWFFMQFSRGAGLVELLGMQVRSTFFDIHLIRPLLNTPKQEIIDFLEKNDIQFFHDKSNDDITYTRNGFRQFLDPFMQQYTSGIQKTLQYLEHDSNQLYSQHTFLQHKGLYIAPKSKQFIRDIDLQLKKMGYLLSAKERETLEVSNEIIVSRKIVVCMNQSTLFIAPFIQNIILPKEYKERYRKAKIPIKLRPYLYREKINIDTIV
jgi:tRNA(Ile)-lysidine synthase